MRIFIFVIIISFVTACASKKNLQVSELGSNHQAADRKDSLTKVGTLPEFLDREMAPSPLDLLVKWDQFYHRGKLVWACRGAQTGAFVPVSNCMPFPQVDSKWPDKRTPGGYSGLPDLD